MLKVNLKFRMQHRRSIAESAPRTRSVRGTPKYLKKYFNDFALIPSRGQFRANRKFYTFAGKCSVSPACAKPQIVE